MKRILLLIDFVLISILLKAQTPTFQWAKSIGGSSQQDASFSICIDSQGYNYTTGAFEDTVDFDPGVNVHNLTSVSNDAFISKFDGNGNFVWAKNFSTFSANDISIGRSVSVDLSGNVYSTGFFSGIVDFDPGVGSYTLSTFSVYSDIFVSKLDANGNFIWAKSFSGSPLNPMGEGFSILTDAFGNVYTTGVFLGTFDFDPGSGVFNLTSSPNSYNVFVSKLDANGNFLWAKNIGGGTLNTQAFSIKTNTTGDVYIAGVFSGTTDFDPGVGTFNLTAPFLSGFILKLDVSGSFVFAKKIQGMVSNAAVFISDMDVDAAGNIYTTGTYETSCDFDPGPNTFSLTSVNSNVECFISKLDMNGNFIYASNVVEFPTFGYASFISERNGNAYVTGSYNGLVDFDPGNGIFPLTSIGGDDAFISKFNVSGTFMWAKSMGGGLNDRPSAISVDMNEDIYTTGTFQGTADFDPGIGTFNLISNGGWDIFVSKLGQGPTTNIVEENLFSSTIYPNPVNDRLKISIDKNYAISKDLKVKLFNNLNQLILEEDVNKYLTDINIQTLPDGIYFVELIKDDNTIIHAQKIIVSKL